MKKIVQLLSLVLCVAMLASMVSCMKTASEEAPDGMQIATVPGEDFRLYIPTTWSPNIAYGISGGYGTLSKRSNVSVVKYEVDSDMATTLNVLSKTVASRERLDWFYQNECLPVLVDTCVAGSLSEVEYKVTENAEGSQQDPAATVLGKEPARRYHQTGKVDNTSLHFMQVVTERKIGNGTAFYVFSYVVDAELYSRYLSDVEKMLTEFIFSDKGYEPDNYLKSLDGEATAPEGMKLASNGEVAYLFYVPTEWKINRDERIFSAYVESDRSSVSVVPYMPDGTNMSTTEMYELSKKMMLSTAGTDGFCEISHDSEYKLDQRPADVYVYTYKVGNTVYKYKQVIVAYKSMLYTVTYTALPENFDKHLGDVDAILNAFRFR